MSTQSDVTLNTADFLEKANSMFGTGFSIAADVAYEMQCFEESALAAKRVFSYSPEDQSILEHFPEFKPVVSAISRLIDKNAPKNQDTKNINNLSKISGSWETLGHCYLALGDFPNSFAAYAHAHRSNPDNPDSILCYTMGILYHHYRYYEHATNCYERVVKSPGNFPYMSDLYFRLGILYRTSGKYDSSIYYFEKCLNNPPNGLLPDDIHLQIAFTFQKMGNNEKADMLYNQLLSKYPNNLELTQQYMWFLYLTLPISQLPRVATLLEEALQRYPSEPILLLLSARVAMKCENMSVAYTNYKNCISYWSDTPIFWCCLGLLYHKNEQIHDAVVAFQRALYLKSELVEAWLNLGLIFEQQDDIQSATRIYQAGCSNCQNAVEIQERLKNAKPRRLSSQNLSLIDIDDSKFFVQVTEQFANNYVLSVPVLPPACFEDDASVDYSILSTTPKSVFVNKENE